MTPETRNIIKFILKFISHKGSFFFWFFIRFISALFPIFSIYLFSQIIALVENKSNFSTVLYLVALIFIIYLLENFTRLLSINKLEYLISGIQFEVHNFLIPDLELKNKSARFEAIQAIRNFSEAVRLTLELIRQPGVDSVVSLIATPLILFFLDFKIFIFEIVYIVVYFFVDVYTTQRYIYLKNLQNAKVEAYYARLQGTNDIDLEEKQYNRVHQKICSWNFIEWFTLQNISICFYSAALLYLIFEVNQGTKNISGLILIIGYLGSTQIFLNSLSLLKDKLADTRVALYRLGKSETVTNIDLDDLIR